MLLSIVSKAFGLNARSRTTQKKQKKSQAIKTTPTPRCISCLEVICCYFRAIRRVLHFKVHLKCSCNTDVLTDLRRSVALSTSITSLTQDLSSHSGQGVSPPAPQDGLWPALGPGRNLPLCGPGLQHRSWAQQLETAGGEKAGKETRSVNPKKSMRSGKESESGP